MTLVSHPATWRRAAGLEAAAWPVTLADTTKGNEHAGAIATIGRPNAVSPAGRPHAPPGIA